MALNISPIAGTDAAALIDRMAGLRVLVVGDVMLDRFIYGSVARVSPEAPIPVFRILRESAMLGGAGNVARNIAAIGGHALLCGLVGGAPDDPDTTAIEALVGEGSGITAHLIHDPERPTTVKTRFVAGSQQLLRADAEAGAPPSATVLASLAARMRASLSQAGVVVVSDYDKGVCAPQTLRTVIEAALAAKLPVVVDPKLADMSRYRGATVIKPNRAELMAASGLPCADDAGVEVAARAMLVATAAQAVVVTRGPQGMSVVTLDAPALHLPTLAQEVFDVSGAGDTVAEVLALGLAAGATIGDAAALANLAAGLVVGKMGTATIGRFDLLDAVNGTHAGAGNAAAKIADRGEAVRRVTSWRARGLRVGFTNGCFDLLHPGHIALLAQARRACDRLVVGLNDDASVGALKGAGRPVQSEAARATVLAALSDVDLVTLFPEDTPSDLIAAIMPEVLIKGADYAEGEIVGAAFVKSRGGEVVRAELVAGQATTTLVGRIRYMETGSDKAQT